ncbi:MAG: hypothetical protein ACPGJI_02940, partial [Kangiellaceae bacterium]
MNNRLIFSFLCILLIAGCTTNNLKSYKLPEEGINAFIAVDENAPHLRSEYSNDTLLAYVLFRPWLGLPAIFGDADKNKKIKKSVEKTIQPIKINLGDSKFSDSYKEKIFESIESVDWIRINKRLESDTFDEYILKVGSHHIFVLTSYLFTKNLDSLEVYTFVKIKKVDRLANKLKKTYPKFTEIFSNSFKYISPISQTLVKSSDYRSKKIKALNHWYKESVSKIESEFSKIKGWNEKNELRKMYHKKLDKIKRPYNAFEIRELRKEYWLENNSEKLKQYLFESIPETQKMLTHLLKDKENFNYKTHRQKLKKISRTAREVSSNKSRLIVEDSQHFLCSIPIGG